VGDEVCGEDKITLKSAFLSFQPLGVKAVCINNFTNCHVDNLNSLLEIIYRYDNRFISFDYVFRSTTLI
jgi:hypothetical protein